MDLARALPRLIPLAVAWAEAEAQVGAIVGERLTEAEARTARAIGVQHPELVRIAIVDGLPEPSHPELRAAAEQTGLIGAGMIGLTLAYTVFIVGGHRTPRVVSHELRHVHQYEQLGSIAAFLPVYLAQIVEFGYANAPLEIDARAHEVRDG